MSPRPAIRLALGRYAPVRTSRDRQTTAEAQHAGTTCGARDPQSFYIWWCPQLVPWAVGFTEARENPVRIRDCPAAVSGNDRRPGRAQARWEQHWASNGGSDRPPAWLHNLASDPSAVVQIGRRHLIGRAEIVGSSPAEHGRLWEVMNAANKRRYDAYQPRPPGRSPSCSIPRAQSRPSQEPGRFLPADARTWRCDRAPRPPSRTSTGCGDLLPGRGLAARWWETMAPAATERCRAMARSRAQSRLVDHAARFRALRTVHQRP